MHDCSCNFKKLLIKIIPSYSTSYAFDFKNQNNRYKVLYNKLGSR